jgi:hypothetical protein
LGRQLLALALQLAQITGQQRELRLKADFISKLGVVEEECDESAY